MVPLICGRWHAEIVARLKRTGCAMTSRKRRTALTVTGSFAFLLGLVWMGQGSGYFPYPPSSFMISQTPWIYWGGLLAVAGVILFLIGRRL
jgi:hypothetical protein